MNRAHLEWPFFEPEHRRLAQEVWAWARKNLGEHPETDVDRTCQRLVRALGEAGFIRYAVGGQAYGGAKETIDTRAVCLIREALAYHHGLADFAFAMQGLGSGAITLCGNEAQRARYLPKVAQGQAIAAFALSEPQAGSDVGGLSTLAQQEGGTYVLNGEKTWISNGGIADFYVVFARAPGSQGSKGISAFVVDADTPGLEVAERLEVMAPHPLATLRFRDCRIPRAQRLGEEGEGFKIAMQTLDIFRTSVAAAALGFARRALDEALARATTRRMFGQTLAEFQLTQAKLAQMAVQIDTAALLTYRAAWLRDQGRRVTLEAAMAKLTATEHAQQVIDAAVQLWGGLGVKKGQVVESLYREIRALRIYEGASEVQQLIIARELLKAYQKPEEVSV
ncbi:MAG: acyl-CoA dehydrogenase family protein [Meiothermus sp.]|uniref:acyl-CoA dehydrogenase family protein n=1 Tax=Meiothermus sp. TaxID=1955249 RepID=UPI0025CD78CB|nr:acyl-CoA dehydrogenase family protein [Meiothermus sp.]MCS7058261.1 acyl-CoA dehydrogenase family protein [Meiothermus sp.]MCS7194828.1 acyl-CoA dehydrogenase family protein [Meiothermus sp.]MCX7741298.1 acyl-CoA dehydrogenase family protein [Meiothermus sp.]MDW8090360.1 acyl-CoA dehydrogenase family protein [Meiothermus sp.]MDW8481139.1 acyl-CoA dehydrogenase family protein [Meiothermus sp.]